MNFTYCPSCGRKGSVQKRDATNYECDECGWHFWNNAKAAVAIFFLREGQFLAAKRGREPNKGKYDAPGGFVDYGENPYDAVIREAQEETGLTVKKAVPVDTASHSYLPNVLPPISSADIIFAVTEWEGEPVAADDVAALEWRPLAFINDEQFVPRYPGLIDKLQSFCGKKSEKIKKH